MSLGLKCEAVARAGLGEPLKHEGVELVYRCPHPERHQHGDEYPSLKVNPRKDVWSCFPCGGKGKAWKLAAFILGVDPSDKKAIAAWFIEKGLLPNRERKSKANAKANSKAEERGPCVATYTYTDASDNPICRKLRFEPGIGGRKKSFAWERLVNGSWVSGLGENCSKLKTPLYRLPQIVHEPWVIVTEGEKDADECARIGLPTTTSGGTGTWRDDHSDVLRSKEVVISADADEDGRIEAQKRAASLYGKAGSVKIVEIPGAKDLAEAIQKGMPREALLALFHNAPLWRPATGAEILDSLVRFIRRFVSLSESQARVLALWVIHTYAMPAADCTPYLSVNSAEKQSGKTRLLEVLRLVVFGAWITGRVTAAVLVRKIHAVMPTLLLDESDAAFSGEKEYAEALRGLLNTGYRRGGCASLCVRQGAKITYQDFSTFCPKAIAGIGKLPDTVADRSIPFRLKRAPRGKVERFRERDVAREAGELSARIAAWVSNNIDALRNARPEIPDTLTDRQADCCEPLLAIADAADGDWPDRSRKALVDLCAGARADESSIGIMLLADIRGIFRPVDDDGNPLPELERIASADLIDSLLEMEDRPWPEYGKARKPISKPQIASLLSKYDQGKDRGPIRPRNIRFRGPDGDEHVLRGYARDFFEEAWSLYLPPSAPVSNCYAATSRVNARENGAFGSATAETCSVGEKAVWANKDAPSGGVALQDPGSGHEVRQTADEPMSVPSQGGEKRWEF